MNLFFLHSPEKRQREQPDNHPVVHNEPSHNITEGGEFLDDVLYTNDRPVTYTEESVAAGSPRNLL
jgi:hypothetical protein